jgi:tetratricopeptide (TPR) repeat protein
VDHLKIRAVTELRRASTSLYLEVMVGNLSMCARRLGLLLALLCTPSIALADDAPDDTVGREYFERGRAAFEEADYESALAYFRHAYELSGRAELQYNIGVAADRLQREDEALHAFRRYLEETKEPTREAEVRQRIDALERTIAQREVTELALEEAALRYETTTTEPIDGRRLPRATIAGGTTLAAVGVAGVAAMTVGLVKNGSCSEEVAGTCVVEHSSTVWTWVYGGVGAAALAGSAAWFAISAKRVRGGRETRFSLSPNGFVVSGQF